MFKYLIILLSTSMSAFAQYFLKVGVGRTNLLDSFKNHNLFYTLKIVFTDFYIIIGFSLYFLSAVFWLFVLSKFNLSKAYPFASLGYVFTLMIGFYFLNEPVNLMSVLAIILIISGVFVLSYSN